MINPSPRLTGRMVFASVLAFFGVVIAVNVTMMMLAIRTLPGTDVDSAYRSSLNYNAEIAAARRQQAQAWRVAGHVERDADGRTVVRVEARDGAGTPATGLAFSALLERPIDKRADRAVPLAERAAGVYRGETVDVAPGQWDLVLEAERGGERVFLSRNRIVLK
jgi:nitrogen fixation protein FixH